MTTAVSSSPSPPAASWQDVNARYLSAALAWLRVRLEQTAAKRHGSLPQPPASVPTPQSTTPAAATPHARRWLFWPGKQTASAAPSGQLPPPETSPEARLAQTAAEYAAAAALTGPAPILMRLGSLLGLSVFERELLLLCIATEIDPDIAALCALAQDDPARPYPTFALALVLFEQGSWDVVSPERPLRYWRLIEIHQAQGQPLTTSPLCADERIVNFIKGLDYLDDRLAALVSAVTAGDSSELPPSYAASVQSIARHLQQTAPGQLTPLVQLLGNYGPSKQLVAAKVAQSVGLHLYRLPAALLPTQPQELESLARLWQRESMLLPLALYIEDSTPEIDAGSAAPVSRLLAGIGGLVFLDGREPLSVPVRENLNVDVAKPSAEEQEAAWSAAIGNSGDTTPARLASQFNLGINDIRRIGSAVIADQEQNTAPLPDRLWDACLALTRPRLDLLAQRLQPKVTWDDLVLPAAESRLLRQIAAQVDARSQVYRGWGFADRMSRGLGISALFAGESGTGKTMAAEVIADSLRLNLYRIDLSAVVSKYIGETEKNLRRLFDAAEDGGAILFFDEADALFGKRSEVKDSHDRYANIEINYLLQRMEAYQGLAILATNMKSALDQAFMRRLRFVVNFPFPGYAERKTLWQKVIPPKTPIADLDFDALAQLNLTGGNIHSIALNAAFAAAQAGGPVTQALVMDAARTELKKLGRVVNELEFRRQGKVVAT